MNELALFAGTGGGILGGKLLGWRTVCAVEIEPYAASVLLQRQNDGILEAFPVWDDICTFDGRPWRGIVDVVSGGFPCQDVSAAGTGKGLDGERSGLWREMARVVCEVRPIYVFVENSPMLTIRGLGVVLGNLAEMGYNAEWGVFRACETGLPHHRARIWILAYSTSKRWICLESHKQEKCPKINLQNIEEKFRSHNLPFSVEQFNNNPSDGIYRNDDGLADGVHRLKAIGNGQVPGVAALAWETLTNRAMVK
jgi:DNA (cytosine-5)-methyltransferase 1